MRAVLGFPFNLVFVAKQVIYLLQSRSVPRTLRRTPLSGSFDRNHIKPPKSLRLFLTNPPSSLPGQQPPSHTCFVVQFARALQMPETVIHGDGSLSPTLPPCPPTLRLRVTRAPSLNPRSFPSRAPSLSLSHSPRFRRRGPGADAYGPLAW